jgi:predicted NAD/FAD-dependent oxidoreductase
MRVVVVGAGLAGLTAARVLTAAGHEVVVLDKGRSPGGRMATRRLAGATFDHGAQFFTVRGAAFATQVAEWEAAGVARVWCHGFGPDPDGYPRYVGAGGMSSITRHVATALDVRCGAMAFGIRPGRGGRAGWDVTVDDGTVHVADAVVVTCPMPQTFSLLVESGVELPRELMTGDYDRTLALLAVLDGPSAIPFPGAVQQPGGIVSFVADNAAKGISAVPAITLHAEAGWSEAHWGDDRGSVHAALVEAAQPWLGGARIVASQVKRWRFATPRVLWPEPCWVAPRGSLVIAGDALAGPRIEGAFDSGRAAAAALIAGST